MLALLLAISDSDDRERINQIFKLYHKDMLSVAQSRMKDHRNAAALAEEAVENALFKITKYIKSIESEGDALRAYVITVTVNECIDILADERDDLSIRDDFPDRSFTEESLVEALHLRERYETVVEGIRLLPDRYRVPMFLRFVEDISPDEIAERLGIPVKTVYTRLDRGRRILKEFVERRLGE